MTIAELLLLNKEKYTRVFLIENNKGNNAANFTEVMEATIDPNIVKIEAKDYFLLDKEAINEIFGNSEELGINEEDSVLMIGL